MSSCNVGLYLYVWKQKREIKRMRTRRVEKKKKRKKKKKKKKKNLDNQFRRKHRNRLFRRAPSHLHRQFLAPPFHQSFLELFGRSLINQSIKAGAPDSDKA